MATSELIITLSSVSQFLEFCHPLPHSICLWDYVPFKKSCYCFNEFQELEVNRLFSMVSLTRSFNFQKFSDLDRLIKLPCPFVGRCGLVQESKARKKMAGVPETGSQNGRAANDRPQDPSHPLAQTATRSLWCSKGAHKRGFLKTERSGRL